LIEKAKPYDLFGVACGGATDVQENRTLKEELQETRARYIPVTAV
jgi:hypothetical protein